MLYSVMNEFFDKIKVYLLEFSSPVLPEKRS